MIDRIGLQAFALFAAAACLVSACQRTTSQPTAAQQAAQSAAEAADAARQSALATAQEASKFGTSEKMVVINHPLHPGTAMLSAQGAPVHIESGRAVSPATLAALHHAEAMHAPAAQLKP